MTPSSLRLAWLAASAEYNQAKIIITAIAVGVAALWLLIDRLPTSWVIPARMAWLSLVAILAWSVLQ